MILCYLMTKKKTRSKSYTSKHIKENVRYLVGVKSTFTISAHDIHLSPVATGGL